MNWPFYYALAGEMHFLCGRGEKFVRWFEFLQEGDYVVKRGPATNHQIVGQRYAGTCEVTINNRLSLPVNGWEGVVLTFNPFPLQVQLLGLTHGHAIPLLALLIKFCNNLAKTTC